MSGPLARLLEDGLPGARLVFGVDGEPKAAEALAARGRHRFTPTASGAAVGALLTNDEPSVEVLLGAISAGARLVSLPLPPRAADVATYADALRAACRAHDVHRVVARDDVAALLEGIGIDALPHSRLDQEPLACPRTGGFDLVQSTSGSTGPAQPIVVDEEVLSQNIMAIVDRIRPQPGDATVSWLPLSHDMGLIGMLLTSLVSAADRWVGGGPVVLLRPEDFLRRPQLWLEALTRWRGTVTAAPDFGYRMATGRVPGDLDLGPLRCAIVGGEVVRATTLRAAAEALGPAGLEAAALCPAYGLAEIGLAATITPPGEHWRERALDGRALADQRLEPPQGQRPATTLAASGPPLAGYGVEVAAPRSGIGGLLVSAPVAGRRPGGRVLTDERGLVPTGDVGFLDDGWLYVCGREDDHVVVHARTLHAPSLEAAIADVGAVRSGRATVVGLAGGEWVVAAEVAVEVLASAVDRDAVERQVRRAAVAASGARPDHVVLLPPGALPMTSSGKVQRHEVRRRWLASALGP